MKNFQKIIITNAKVWTGNDTQAWADTIVIKNDRIIAVGGSELKSQYSNVETIYVNGQLAITKGN